MNRFRNFAIAAALVAGLPIVAVLGATVAKIERASSMQAQIERQLDAIVTLLPAQVQISQVYTGFLCAGSDDLKTAIVQPSMAAFEGVLDTAVAAGRCFVSPAGPVVLSVDRVHSGPSKDPEGDNVLIVVIRAGDQEYFALAWPGFNAISVGE